MKYSSVHIIYNPNSTGDSETMARQLQKLLKKQMKSTPINIIPTKRAGHAEQIALEIAKAESKPLIVSSSGDGGYNEVINGVMKANNLHAICAVLPAGNANDHSRTMQSRPLEEVIIKNAVTRLDLLKVIVKSTDRKRLVRYAHSYVGLGLTPVVATELNRHTLNAFREAGIVLKTFFKYRPFKIKHAGRVLKLDSLLFGNINQMAKVLTLSPKNKPKDGKFEVVMFPAGRKLRLIKTLAKATISHLENVTRESSYSFTVIKRMPMQLDGEVMSVSAHSEIQIQSARQALLTIV